MQFRRNFLLDLILALWQQLLMYLCLANRLLAITNNTRKSVFALRYCLLILYYIYFANIRMQILAINFVFRMAVMSRLSIVLLMWIKCNIFFVYNSTLMQFLLILVSVSCPFYVGILDHSYQYNKNKFKLLILHTCFFMK